MFIPNEIPATGAPALSAWPARFGMMMSEPSRAPDEKGDLAALPVGGGGSALPQTAADADAALMVQVREARDLAAFEELVRRYQDCVFNMVSRMLGDTRDADDITQQVFLRVWKSARRYKARAKFSTWLFTIARNLTLNEVRRRKRHPATSLDEPPPGAPPDSRPDNGAHERLGDTGQSSPSDQFLQSELEQALEDAIAALPEKQRLALILWRYQQLPYEEIAQVLKTSTSAVKSLLFRARTELKQKLAAYLEG
jgi:RNA polymerase sigma-70 factor (ECF subfamily)